MNRVARSRQAATSGRLRRPTRSIAPAARPAGGGHRAFRLAGAAEHDRPGVRSGHAVKEGGETLGRPDLRQPVRRRRQRDHRVIAQMSEMRSCIGGGCPDDRAGRRGKLEDGAELNDLRAARAAEHRAAPCRHQPGQCRTADVDDEVPQMRQSRRPQRQPMPAAAPLAQHDGALAVRHAREDAFGDRAANHGDPRIRVGPDQMVEQPGGQHRIAQPVGGHEQDFHSAAALAAPDRFVNHTLLVRS